MRCSTSRAIPHHELVSAGTAGTFNNSGTFRKSAGTGTSTIANPFNNTGTVDVQTGTIDITGSFSNFSAQTLTGGTYDIQSTFNFTGADISHKRRDHHP